ncbi:hypothetical protein B0H17DRAFT_314703 [Mycena rosella]|uniref:Uncharacterized protein n=1 Tax=Mycena rosella TaxID=1033263 RepID=A0AAD7G5U8_MYCRO|nr:hypothetical protein B0H17DRAFT_314703 [Mycena rosella]
MFLSRRPPYWHQFSHDSSSNDSPCSNQVDIPPTATRDLSDSYSRLHRFIPRPLPSNGRQFSSNGSCLLIVFLIHRRGARPCASNTVQRGLQPTVAPGSRRTHPILWISDCRPQHRRHDRTPSSTREWYHTAICAVSPLVSPPASPRHEHLSSNHFWDIGDCPARGPSRHFRGTTVVFGGYENAAIGTALDFTRPIFILNIFLQRGVNTPGCPSHVASIWKVKLTKSQGCWGPLEGLRRARYNSITCREIPTRYL